MEDQEVKQIYWEDALMSVKSYLERRCKQYDQYRKRVLNGSQEHRDKILCGELIGMEIALGAIEEAMNGECPVD